MARPLRIEYPGALYHVTSRGNARMAIYKDDPDRTDFLEVFQEVITRFNWLCHAYCLMKNHYHLLIETPEGNLSMGMRQLNGVYTQRFNRRHCREGHIFQGRFKAILVERDSYFLELCRYIVLNPVRTKTVALPDHYAWSSYPATAGLRKVPSFLTRDWVLGQFGRGRGEAEKRYRGFVGEGIKGKSPWSDLRGQVILGSERFLEGLEPHLSGQSQIKEVPRSQRFVNRPALGRLLNQKCRIVKKTRDRAIHEAYFKHGYTLGAIASFLGIHYTTVSKVIHREKGN